MAAKVLIKAQYVQEGKAGTAEAEVPFATGKYRLPEVYPFTVSTYVGPDAGYTLGWVAVDAEQNLLTFAFLDILPLKDGKAQWKGQYRGEDIVIDFVLE